MLRSLREIFPKKVRKIVDSVVAKIETQIHDASLTAMDSVVIPRVEMAVKLVTGISGHEMNSRAIPAERYFQGTTQKLRFWLHLAAQTCL